MIEKVSSQIDNLSEIKDPDRLPSSELSYYEQKYPVISKLVTLDEKSALEEILLGIRDNKISIIKIDGLSGSGKTLIAGELDQICTKKGYRVIPIKYDNYFYRFAQELGTRDLSLSDRAELNSQMFNDVKAEYQKTHIETDINQQPSIIILETPFLNFEDRGTSLLQRLVNDPILSDTLMVYTVLADPRVTLNALGYRSVALELLSNDPKASGSRIAKRLNNSSNIKIPTNLPISRSELKRFFLSMANPQEIIKIVQDHRKIVDKWLRNETVTLMACNLDIPDDPRYWSNLIVPQDKDYGYYDFVLKQITQAGRYFEIQDIDYLSQTVGSAAFAMTILKRLGFTLASDPHNHLMQIPKPTNARVVINKFNPNEEIFYFG